MAASPSSAVAVASSRHRIPSSTRAHATSVAPSSASPSISRSTTPNRRPTRAARCALAAETTLSPLSRATKPSWNASQP
jgi:hypothetical protein